MKEKFELIIRNKLLRHPLVVDSYDDSKPECKKVVVFLEKLFEYVYKNYKVIHKHIFESKPKSGRIAKLCLLPIAYQNCGSTPNKIKVKSMFHILSVDNQLSKDSQDMRMFLYFMLAYPTNISIVTINEMAQEYEDMRKELSEDKFLEIYNAYETKDAIEAVEDYMTKLFDGKATLSLNEFEESIVKNKLVFIFDSKGVRQHLDKRNHTHPN